ncbi:MAG: hypothetical protein ACOCXI_10325 [Chloroflexota bacterium]
MPDDIAQKVIQSLADEQRVALFAARLRAWLLADLSEEDPLAGRSTEASFSESRARALLRATEAADEPGLSDFATLAATAPGARFALYDLLQTCDLAENADVQALATMGHPEGSQGEGTSSDIPWLSLVMAAHAYQRGYPLQQLDPASPPERYSPAGQIVWRTAQFLRRQVQRSATERDRVAQTLAPRPGESTAALEELHEDRPIPPLPPHFRPPVPVRYPEISRDTVRIEGSEDAPESVTRGEPLVITEDDLAQEQQATSGGEEDQEPGGQPVRMPPIRIERSQVEPSNPPSPLPSSGVIMPGSTTESRPGLTVAIRQMFRSEEMTTTRLRVLVRDKPDGDGLYGLQVKVTCRGIKSFVAGTTNRDGEFVAELPVRYDEGLTYDVDVTWPRELGGESERKSITLHADRTEFTLPFHHRMGAAADGS